MQIEIEKREREREKDRERERNGGWMVINKTFSFIQLHKSIQEIFILGG
jgi:hypothetical protein